MFGLQLSQELKEVQEERKKNNYKCSPIVLDMNQKELETLWLADKLYEIVENENDLGLSALKVAENEFKYQTKIKG